MESSSREWEGWRNRHCGAVNEEEFSCCSFGEICE